MRIDRCSLAIVTSILIVTHQKAEAERNAASSDEASDPPATHNMLVVGGKSAFLSHLPMFDDLSEDKSDYTSMHRYQVILEARFTRGRKDVTDTYTKDRQNNEGIKIYTLQPKRFVLARLFTPTPEKPTLSSFRATIFRDHLERNGETINGLEDVVVDVKRIVHARKFDPAEEKPLKLEYILFGRGDELFLAHLITKPPDFDQIISVKSPGHRFTDEELEKGVRVLLPERKNTAAQRIKENEQAQAQFQVANGSQVLNLPVQTGTEYYFEEGELALPAIFDQTPEEKKAGF
ncbi:MAG TPA: hypothetical protein VIS99_17470 [Terrimicrobiaceae bacterium]